MKFTILPRYLIGSREAIRDVATSPIAPVCSILFVVSAGFAREYDGEDLVHEPWHVLRPLGASLASGTVLFLLVHGVATGRPRDPAHPRPTLRNAYLTFMTLFWMTAPLAWLYAIPYERVLSPVDAVAANLWTLGLVAAWRVVLIVRVISVIYGTRVLPTFFLVMFIADAVVFAVVTLVPTPVIDVMGGLRHTERDALVAAITLNITVLSLLSAPVWVIGAVASARPFRPRWPGDIWDRRAPRGRGMLALAIASILVWAPALCFTQGEQSNRRRAEEMMTSGSVSEGLAYMSARRRTDFPPYWDAPPRMGYSEQTPETYDITNAMRAQWPADWVAEMYLAKVRRAFLTEVYVDWDPPDWRWFADRILDSDDPWSIDLVSDVTDEGRFLVEFDPTIPDDIRERLRSALAPY